MNRQVIRGFALAGLLAVGSPASERAVVKITCPLDGTEFTAVQDFSGYATGLRLDLKKMGPISQPWALARCPECGYPVFEKYPSEERARQLKEIVASERFRTEARPASPWFALGVLKEEMKAEAFDIGMTYLNASWEAEEDRAPESYARAAQRALTWFDRAAVALVDQPDRTKDRCIALYLPIELARRLGNFDEAQRRVRALPDMSVCGIAWLPAALKTQAQLIAAKDSSACDNGE